MPTQFWFWNNSILPVKLCGHLVKYIIINWSSFNDNSSQSSKCKTFKINVGIIYYSHLSINLSPYIMYLLFNNITQLMFLTISISICLCFGPLLCLQLNRALWECGMDGWFRQLIYLWIFLYWSKFWIFWVIWVNAFVKKPTQSNSFYYCEFWYSVMAMFD